MSYTNNDALMKVLSEYNDCNNFANVIYEIIIVWNNPTVEFNFNHKKLRIDMNHSIPIHVYSQKTNSLTNRWLISKIHSFSTKTVFFIDDDFFMNQYAIKCLLSTWNKYPNTKLIAPSITSTELTTRSFIPINNNKYVFAIPYPGDEYFDHKYFNMLLPGYSLQNVKYLPIIAKLFEKYELIDIIDNHISHCDDVALMLLYSIMNNGKPFLMGIDHIKILDISNDRKKYQKSLTQNNIKIRLNQISECLNLLINKINNINPLITHSLLIVNHQRHNNTIDCKHCEICDKRACSLPLSLYEHHKHIHYGINIEWDLIDSIQNITQFLQNNQNDKDISYIISAAETTIKYCGSQYYSQKFKKQNVYYLQIHDVVFQPKKQSLWIFIVNYALETNGTKYFIDTVNDITNGYLLCAYNDGTTYISQKIKLINRWYYYAVVECDVPAHLIPSILAANISTNITVSIINPLYINTMNSFIISIPVCSKWHNINHNNTYWDSTAIYHRHHGYKHQLSACSILHPKYMEYSHKYDQAMFILRDWIEYNFGMLGIEHFILYQHIIPTDSFHDIQHQQSIVIDVLYPYIVSGIVTYIPWYNELNKNNEFTFQFSMFNSCLKRFGHTKFSKYLMFLDVDEYIIPTIKYKHLKLLDLIQLSTSNYAYEFTVYCKYSFTCNNNMGCSKNQTFDSVLERHRCIADDIGTWHSNKQIVEALKVELMFIHFVDTFVDYDYDHTIKLPYTVDLKNNLCVHAKSNLLVSDRNVTNIHQSKHINNMIKQYKNYMENNSTAIHQSRLLPLYQNESAYCNY